MKRSTKTSKNNNQYTINKYLILALLGSLIVLTIAVFNLVQTSNQVQSYAGQKGAPEKPPKNVYNIVTGTVYGSGGETIAGAKVESSQKTVRRYVMTDQAGRYTIEFPYCVNCKSVITYSARGYQEKSIDTYQIPGGTLVQDVVLQKL